MATTEKRKPVFVKVDALTPGTNGHNLTVQVVSSNPIQVFAPTKPRRPPIVSLSQRRPITPARIAECLVGDDTGCILFTARNEQVRNSRCTYPGHLWLTGCKGQLEDQLQKLPGYDKWKIEKESQSYIEALQDQKENLVYLTADSETVLEELDPKKIYIVGGLVDRNRWKGITMKKAEELGIQTAKLPIGNYLKMTSSQVKLEPRVQKGGSPECYKI